MSYQDQLVDLIMRVLVEHDELHYYQGYHDICVTFLLVLGEDLAFATLNVLSLQHLRYFKIQQNSVVLMCSSSNVAYRVQNECLCVTFYICAANHTQKLTDCFTLCMHFLGIILWRLNFCGFDGFPIPMNLKLQ